MSQETEPVIHVDSDVEVTMRDGTVLRADVYRPDVAGDVPTLVQRTPYDKSAYDGAGRAFAARGYMHVVQDVRGQFASDGTFEPWVNEGRDGFDTIEWAATLAGSTGRVGTLGTSYQAAAQWQAARLRPPHLAAMVTPVTPADYYDQWVYPSGAFALSFNTTWLLNNVARTAARRLPDGDAVAQKMALDYDGLISGGFDELPLDGFSALHPDDEQVAPYFFAWLAENGRRNDYWQQLSMRGHYGEVDVPVLSYEGWYDVFVDGGIENFVGMRTQGGSDRARRHSKLIVGPYVHNAWGPRVGSVDFGPEAADTSFATTIEWFDHWLKDIDNDAERHAPVRYFTMGVNQWQDADRWPPLESATAAYTLRSDAGANSVAGDGRLVAADTADASPGSPFDTFTYDPLDPVPSIGGNGCCYAPQAPMGPQDQRPVEARQDVLVYSTGALSKDVQVSGAAGVTLWVSSTAPSTDFTAKLVDVHPDGTAVNISEGISRVDLPGAADEPSRLEIVLHATSTVFRASHRIRLEVSSSNFPLYDRNLNTASSDGYVGVRTAAQRVFHDDRHRSGIELPVLPRDGLSVE